MPDEHDFKHMIKKGLLIFGLLTACGVSAQNVTPYAPKGMEEGVVYYLPKTQIEVKATVTKVTYTPGELCQYANRYLRINDLSSTPSEYWEIKSIEVSTIGIPDANKAYSIKLKDKMATSKVELTENGIIKAINTTSNIPSAPTKTIEPTNTPKVENVDPRSFMTEEILLASSSNKMAELVAKEIYNIRESKNSLTRGQADYMPQDGAALQIMLNNLETQEKAMTEMFTGKTIYTDQTFTFYLEPSKDTQNQTLFRFSKKLGVLESNNLAGEPITITITDASNLPPATEETKAKKKPVGVIYNIPGKAKISIDGMAKNYLKDELIVTQFGETEILVENLFNKKENTRVIFNPTTGGIVKIDKD